jgi:hypothetical protein
MLRTTDVQLPPDGQGIPAAAVLEQNYPNPFNPVTTIRYSVGEGGLQAPGVSTVRLTVYDLLGREVATLVQEQKSAGTYTVQFDAGDLPSGSYVYRLTAGTTSMSRMMTVLR